MEHASEILLRAPLSPREGISSAYEEEPECVVSILSDSGKLQPSVIQSKEIGVWRAELVLARNIQRVKIRAYLSDDEYVEVPWPEFCLSKDKLANLVWIHAGGSVLRLLRLAYHKHEWFQPVAMQAVKMLHAAFPPRKATKSDGDSSA
jgi:hypothetical protein